MHRVSVRCQLNSKVNGVQLMILMLNYMVFNLTKPRGVKEVPVLQSKYHRLTIFSRCHRSTKAINQGMSMNLSLHTLFWGHQLNMKSIRRFKRLHLVLAREETGLSFSDSLLSKRRLRKTPSYGRLLDIQDKLLKKWAWIHIITTWTWNTILLTDLYTLKEYCLMRLRIRLLSTWGLEWGTGEVNIRALIVEGWVYQFHRVERVLGMVDLWQLVLRNDRDSMMSRRLKIGCV